MDSQRQQEIMSRMHPECIPDKVDNYILKCYEEKRGAFGVNGGGALQAPTTGSLYIADWTDKYDKCNLRITCADNGSIIKEKFDNNGVVVDTEYDYKQKLITRAETVPNDTNFNSLTDLSLGSWIETNRIQPKNKSWINTVQPNHTDEEYDMLLTELSMAKQKNEEHLDIIIKQSETIHGLNQKVTDLSNVIVKVLEGKSNEINERLKELTMKELKERGLTYD